MVAARRGMSYVQELSSEGSGSLQHRHVWRIEGGGGAPGTRLWEGAQGEGLQVLIFRYVTWRRGVFYLDLMLLL